MAYQWNTSYWGQYGSTYNLAGVIQGEAATSSGQFAVASVIQNRMDGLNGGGYVGAGSGNIQSVVTPSQFNGWQPPGPQAMAYATALQNGTLSQYGNTGNATFYAAPSQSNASWANPNTASGQGLFGAGNNQIGGNYYSDRLGPPTSNFQAPQYGGGSYAGDAAQDRAQDMNEYGYGSTSGSTGTIANAGGNGAYPGTNVGNGQPNYMPDSVYDNQQNLQEYGYDGGQNYASQNGAAQAGSSYNPAPIGSGGAPSFTKPDYGAENTYDPATGTEFNSIQPDNVSPSNIPQKDGLYAQTGPVDTGGSAFTSTTEQQQYGYSPVQQAAPFQQATPNAQAGQNSTAYAGDMDVAPAIDTLARSVAASAQSQNQATSSAANTIGQGLSGVGSSIQQGAKQTAGATTSLAQTVAGSTGSLLQGLSAMEVSAFSWTTNIFLRGVVVVLAVVFVAAALHMFGATQNTIVDPVNVGRRAAKGAARAAAAAA